MVDFKATPGPVPRLAYRPEEAAAALGLKSFRTLYNWRNEGRISFVKIGRASLITKDEIDRILREGAELDRMETEQGKRKETYADRVEKRAKSKAAKASFAAR